MLPDQRDETSLLQTRTPWSTALLCLLRTAIPQTTVKQLLRPVERREGPRGGRHAVADEDEGYDDPEGVHQDKVSPVVRSLWPRVGETQHALVEQARRVVQHVAVELAERYDDLEGVTERVVDGDERGREKRERAPGGLEGQQASLQDGWAAITAVMLSMHSTKALSAVR
jgi:hypothetical protein